jgi:cysteinyl-tRNA synthetase
MKHAKPLLQKNGTDLTQLIREEVKAQLRRYVMAASREEYINRLTDVLIPALKHHYRVSLAVLNSRTDQVEKWQQQLSGFLDQFADRLQGSIKAKGLDRRKALVQAVKELMEQDASRRRGETALFQRCYKLKMVKPLPDNAHDEFLARVWEMVDIYFPPPRHSTSGD